MSPPTPRSGPAIPSAGLPDDLTAVVAEIVDLAGQPPGVIQVRDGGDGWGVISTVHADPLARLGHRTSPCGPCPWRRDAPIGAFPPAVFRYSAATAYDLSMRRFVCHTSSAEEPLTCAGFLLRGADHNLAIRASNEDYSAVDDRGLDLYDSYVEMATANGVDPADPVLAPCRSDRQGRIGGGCEKVPAQGAEFMPLADFFAVAGRDQAADEAPVPPCASPARVSGQDGS
ncbi:DUF6283 family protein [Streptosporangium canum]|uniref:DUF6283 family protein n=1 Tax=Streptosporangium canum TaxID=324952 RepID=UPI0037999E36